MTPDTLAPAESPSRLAAPPVATPKMDWLLQADIELRVLQGPQAGCRLAIAPGQTYTVGSADECSVVLVGQHVQPEHAELQVLADMVRIRPIGGPIWIDGLELPREGEPWELGTVFLVGRVALCVDEVDMPWPSEEVIAASSALASQGAAGEPGPGLDDEPDSGFEDSQKSDDPDAEPLTHTADEPAPQAAPTALLTPVLNERSDRNTRLLLIGAGVALLGALAAAGWIGWAAHAVPGIRPQTMRMAADTNETPSPQTRDAARSSTLPRAAPTMPPPERVAERLDALARELSIPGRVSVRWASGPLGPEIQVATTDTGQSSGLLARIEAVRAETGPVSVNLLGPADMAARFREALQASSLQRKFVADPADPDQLTYKASLTMEDIPAWERLFLSFTQTHGDVPPVTVRVNTDLDRLGSRIGSVVGGAFPYIVTPEGQRIAPGGSLMGRTVASVQIGEIVFADGVRYRFTP